MDTVTQVSPGNCLLRIQFFFCPTSTLTLTPTPPFPPQSHPLPGPSRQVSAGAPLRGERLGAPADGGALRGHLQPPELPGRSRWVLRRRGHGMARV